jgi:hypothetical protein
MSIKPPLGLRPKQFVNELRISEILDAICRYHAANQHIPLEWIAELHVLRMRQIADGQKPNGAQA